MLKSIRIKNFKALKDCKFKLSNLTLLTGLNGVGKSCLIQSLLLLRQSYERRVLEGCLVLNGKYVSIGVGRDVLCAFADSNEISFKLEWDGPQNTSISYTFPYDCDDKSDYVRTTDLITRDDLSQLSPFGWDFHYLAIGRGCCNVEQKCSEFNVLVEENIGINGEYLAHYIHEFAFLQLRIPQLRHERSTTDSLIHNVNCWLGEICPGLLVSGHLDDKGTYASLDFHVLDENAPKRVRNMSAEQVGMGVVDTVAVLVSILRAKPGDFIILEHPESFMHGAAQSLIGKLCAIAANNGAQILVETHSDALINGARVAVRQKKLAPNKVRIFNFSRDPSDIQSGTQIETLKIDKDGMIDHYPEYFLDQFEKDLDSLAKS